MWVNEPSGHVEQSGAFIILFGAADPYQLQTGFEQMPLHWDMVACPLPAHRWLPKSLLLVHFQRYCWLFSSSTGSWWGEYRGWPWQTWLRSTLPRVSEHSDVTGFFSADPSLLPRMHSRETKQGSCEVSSQDLFFAQREPFSATITTSW